MQTNTLLQEFLNQQEFSLDEYLKNLENDNDDDDSDLFSTDLSDYTDFVSKTLNMPLSQVYLQATQNPIGFLKLIEKAKRSMRRNKAKERSKFKRVKIDTTHISTETNQKKSKDTNSQPTISQDDESEPEIETKRQKKINKAQKSLEIPIDGDLNKRQIQMIRNRISAQNSRDRKKAYLTKLEQNQNSIVEENNTLKLQIHNLNQEINSCYEEINILKNQNNQIKESLNNKISSLICQDCKSCNIVDQSEFYDISLSPPHYSSTNISKLSLGFFTIFSIFCLITYSMNQTGLVISQSNTDQSRILFELPDNNILNIKSQQNLIVKDPTYHINDQTKILPIGDAQYNVLHKIHELREQNQQNSIVEYGSELINPRKKFLEKTKKDKQKIQEQDIFQNQIATLDQFYPSQPFSSIYCPNSYIYQDFKQNGVKVIIQDQSWVHLLIPRQNITMFYENWQSQQINIREQNKQNNEPQTEKQQFTEIWCQVKKVNDFFIETE